MFQETKINNGFVFTMILGSKFGKTCVFFMIQSTDTLPLITVVITTHNYAGYLPKAIESIINQTYKNFEIIVVDDGSTDNTKSIIDQYQFVTYLYQENKGVSAARNAGIAKAKGNYLVFLDADDWLEKDALEQNYNVIRDKPDVAFVSGNYIFLRAEKGTTELVSVEANGDHYARLLQSNYIGMLAAVMFQRWIFNEIQFDESLPSCEDYDLYLSVARKHPVVHHQHFIATYFFHSSSLSHKYETMRDCIITVIEKQQPHLQTDKEKEAYAMGLQQWKDYQYLLEESPSIE